MVNKEFIEHALRDAEKHMDALKLALEHEAWDETRFCAEVLIVIFTKIVQHINERLRRTG